MQPQSFRFSIVAAGLQYARNGERNILLQCRACRRGGDPHCRIRRKHSIHQPAQVGQALRLRAFPHAATCGEYFEGAWIETGMVERQGDTGPARRADARKRKGLRALHQDEAVLSQGRRIDAHTLRIGHRYPNRNLSGLTHPPIWGSCTETRLA
jgi:hypothetical protein